LQDSRLRGNDGMIEDFGVCLGSVFAAHRKLTGIRLAPKVTVPGCKMNDSYQDVAVSTALEK